MSLLTVVQRASVQVGIDKPTAALGSGNSTYEQMAELANVEGEELARAADWRALNRQLTVTGDGTTTLWGLPSDFERFIIPDPLWEEDRPMFPLEGPYTPSQMLAIQAANINPPYYVWRLVEEELEIYPALPSAKVINGEYFTTKWATDSTDTNDLLYYTNDSDIALIDERIITLGVVWRWKRAKGMDYVEEFRTYEMEKAKRIGADGGKSVVSSSRSNKWLGASRKNAYQVTG